MSVGCKQILLATLLIMFFFDSALQAGNGNVVHLTGLDSTYYIDNEITFLTEEEQAYTILEILENETLENQFKNYPIDADFESNQYYWGKIQLINEMTNVEESKNWILDFSWMITGLDVYIFDEKGGKKHYKTGAFLPPNERSFRPRIKANLVSIELPFKEKVSIYFRAISKRTYDPPEFKLQLIEKEAYFIKLIREKAWNYFYLGIVFVLLVSNLILRQSTEIKAYGYYAIYLLGIIFYSAYKSGDLADLLYPLSANFLNYIYYFKLSIYFALVSYIAFIRSILNLEERMSRFDGLLKRFCVAAIPFAGVEMFCIWKFNYSYYPSDGFNTLYAVGFAFLVVYLLGRMYKWPSNKKTNYIFKGTFCMLFGIIATALMRFKGVDFSFTVFQLSSLAEFFFFAKGLVYVRKEVEQQKLEAVTAKEMIQFKDRFYGNLIHEFKTPLTVLKGLTTEKEINIESKWLIQQNIEQLEQLINQLLDISTLESGKLIANYQRVEIIAHIKHWIASLKPLADRKKQLISFESAEKTIYIDTDLIQLEKIIFNLLSNAIKFTPVNGAIEIAANQEGQKFHLYIKDTGDGIPAAQIDKIYERFYTTDKNSTSMIEGTGIGLSLVKELTEWMGGKIEATSEEGEGTVFHLLFPVRQAEPTIRLEKPTILEKEMVFAPFSPELAIIEEYYDPVCEKPTVLVIEDNEGLVLYFKQLLKEKYQIIAARDGKEGIAKAIEIIPDIIICDLMMPKLNGYEVCQRLKKEELTNHIPIIMITAKSGMQVRIKGLEEGVDIFLNKPFNKRELLIYLSRLITRQQEMQSLLLRLPKEEIPKREEKIDNLDQKEKIFFKEQKFLKKVNQMIDENMDNLEYNTDLLCHDLGIKKGQLYKKISYLTGYNTTKYIRFYKAIKAKALIENTPKSITEISYDVGFKSPNSFNKAFKEFYDKPPSSFRK